MPTLKEKFKKSKSAVIIFSVIFLVGLFLRTYKFHDWLEFRDDQTRDAYLTSDVVAGRSSWPLAGPFMSYSGAGDHNEANSFHLGPMYYYFQIISAKLFGDYPDRLAYPDVFFSILSIPLFYLFLRICFGRNLSLSITGLYAISFFFIRYSRIAVNSNLAPFFVLLLLLSLHKFLKENEKTPWIWVLFTGIALGVGFQLHAIIMIIFSLTVFSIFLFSIKKNQTVWKKWAVVFLIFLALNASQGISELRTNFNNTKNFFNFPTQRNAGGLGVLTLAKNDIVCHIEANFLFISAYGNDKCSPDFSHVLSSDQVSNFLNISKDKINLPSSLVILIFSITGYFLFVFYNRKEKEAAKKYFLRLIALYIAIGYLVMLPLNGTRLGWLEYYRFSFFMPFIFLGFFMKFIAEKFAKKYIIISAIIIFAPLIFSNLMVISKTTSRLLDKSLICSSHFVALGELEPVADYLGSRLNGQRVVYVGEDKTLSKIHKPFRYLLDRQNIHSIEIGSRGLEKLNKIDKQPTFILSCSSKMSTDYPYEKINHIYVYQIKH